MICWCIYKVVVCCLLMSKFTKENELHPTLVRLKRTKDVVTQACDVYISRECSSGNWSLNRSKWYNPECCNDLQDYHAYLLSDEELYNNIYELVGQTLGCWCSGNKGKSCHGNILISETKDFLRDYFKRLKENCEYNNESGVTMTINPLEVYSLERNEIVKHKRYKLEIHDNGNDGGDNNDTPPPPQQQPAERVSKRHKVDLSDVPKICWDSNCNKWLNVDRYAKRTDGGYVLLVDATISWSDGNSYDWPLQKGLCITDNGRIDVGSIIRMGCCGSDGSDVTAIANVVDFASLYTKRVSKLPEITKGRVSKLFSCDPGKFSVPFVCKVQSRLFNKRSNRYMLKVFDGVDEYKINLGSQLFEMIKQKFIDKEDLIEVVDYAATMITPMKRYVGFYTINKIVIG